MNLSIKSFFNVVVKRNSVRETTVKSYRKHKQARKLLCHDISNNTWFMTLGVGFTGSRLTYMMNENTVCGSRHEGCEGEKTTVT